jgi:hypothetical protein
MSEYIEISQVAKNKEIISKESCQQKDKKEEKPFIKNFL